MHPLCSFYAHCDVYQGWVIDDTLSKYTVYDNVGKSMKTHIFD